MGMFEEDSESKTRAEILLSKLKAVEKQTKMYTRKVGKTIVSCKREEDLEKFENQLGNFKIVFKNGEM